MTIQELYDKFPEHRNTPIEIAVRSSGKVEVVSTPRDEWGCPRNDAPYPSFRMDVFLDEHRLVRKAKS